MKRYFDKNNKLLRIGDVVHCRILGEDRLGKIVNFKQIKDKFQTYYIAYIELLGYSYGTWESTCLMTKVTDEEMMLIMLEQ